MTNAEDPVPCSLCGSPGDEKHMIAIWSYCTSCGEALDRELVEYERANRTALDTYIGLYRELFAMPDSENDSPEADDIRERMDRPWRDMTGKQRDESDAIIERIASGVDLNK